MGRPDSGDKCTCGHTYGDHSRATLGPCMARRNDDVIAEPHQIACECPHWREPVWNMAGELTACIAEEAHLAEANPAAHDAWQLALQHLEPLRAAIDRARRCGGGE